MTTPTPAPSPTRPKIDVFQGICVDGSLVIIRHEGVFPQFPVDICLNDDM